jgi:hypothetical protein
VATRQTEQGVKTFDRFDGGDYGVLAGFRAGQNVYSGADVQAYLDGSVGPRCGTTPIVSVGTPTGKLAGMGFFTQDAGAGVPWYIVGNSVYVSLETPAALASALAVTPSEWVNGVSIGPNVYLSVYGDKLYRASTTVVDPIGALAPGGKAACSYGERLLVANFPGNTNRVRFSDANDFTTWGALSYFDVGQGGEITGLWTVRTNVFISKNDGSWWIYSGVPGSGSDVLRLAYSGSNYPADQRSGAVVAGSSVWFVAQGEQFPSYFNGSNVSAIAEQDTLGELYSFTATGVEPRVSLTALTRRGDLLALAGHGLSDPNRTSLLLRDGKWSRHSVAEEVAAPVPGATRVLLSDGGDVAAPPTFSWWVPTSLERPGLGGQFDAVTDANLAAEITLPEHVDMQGRDLKVQRVLVNFRKFNQASYANHVECQVTATRVGHDGSDVIGATRTWDEVSTHGSASGVPDRTVFYATDQGIGTGWIVRLRNLLGVVIDTVTVYYEIRGTRV